MDEATLSVLFTIANGVAIVGWLPLLIAPKWKGTRTGVTIAVVALLALAYVILLLSGLGDAEGGFGSLTDVMLLFTHPQAVLTGWIHYLAFDLFVGTWMTQDWQATGHPHYVLLPTLILTFMAGPAGLLLYLLLRTAVRKDPIVVMGMAQ